MWAHLSDRSLNSLRSQSTLRAGIALLTGFSYGSLGPDGALRSFGTLGASITLLTWVTDGTLRADRSLRALSLREVHLGLQEYPEVLEGLQAQLIPQALERPALP